MVNLNVMRTRCIDLLAFSFFFFLFPSDVRPIAISKQLILKETVRNLQYEVYGYGFVIESADIMRVWIEMDVPFSSMFLARDGRSFIVMKLLVDTGLWKGPVMLPFHTNIRNTLL